MVILGEKTTIFKIQYRDKKGQNNYNNMPIPATAATSSKAVRRHTHHLTYALLLQLSLNYPLVCLPTAGLIIIIIIIIHWFSLRHPSHNLNSNIVHKSWTIHHKAGNYSPGSLRLSAPPAGNITITSSMLDEVYLHTLPWRIWYDEIKMWFWDTLGLGNVWRDGQHQKEIIMLVFFSFLPMWVLNFWMQSHFPLLCSLMETRLSALS